MSEKWIIVDLDGTLCDCSHRVHWAQAKEWDSFHSGIMEDEMNEDVFTAIKCLSNCCNILVCTGRDERQILVTQRWMNQKGVSQFIDQMIFRPEGDFTPDHELKPRMVAEFFGGEEAAKEAVLFVLDDRDKVVEAWRNSGYKCWQVQVGSY